MASEYSFDIESTFDMQELKNAVEQMRKEITNRYDFKGLVYEADLTEEVISIKAPDTFKLEAIKQVLISKVVGRKLSPKIFDYKTIEATPSGTVKQDIKLIKAMDQETAKLVSKIIRDAGLGAKPSIQGPVVRVTSKDKDELQAVMQLLRGREDITVPLVFGNYR